MASYLPSKDDLQHLRPQLFVALFATLSGLALLAIAVFFHGQISAQLLSAKAEGAELQQRIDHFATEEAELREEVRQYGVWVSRGIFGAEQRVKWTTALRQIRQRRHLIALHYEFSPQQALGLPLPIPAGMPFHFVTSPVHLSVTARHDGDLIGLFDDLGADIPAYVRPRRCLMERKHSEQPGAASQLQMDCQMDWITVSHAP